MKFTITTNESGGFALVEVLLASALFALSIGAIVGGIIYGSQTVSVGGTHLRAVSFATEGLEGVRNIRDEQFSNLTDGTFGLHNASNTWMLSGTSTETNGMTRLISVGSVDANTKAITSTVSWSGYAGKNETLSLSTHLTNWRKTLGKKSGMLAYGDYSGSDDVIRYKLFSDTGVWSAEQTIPDTVPGAPALRSLELYSSKTRNEKIVVSKHFLANTQSIYASVWDGTSWGNAVTFSSWVNSALPESQSYDGDYLSNGQFLIVYSDGTTTPKYRVWDGSSWSAQSSLPTIGGVPNWIIARVRPNTNELMVVIRDDQGATRTTLWDGSSWSVITTHAVTSSGVTFKNIDFTWNIVSSTIGALVYTSGGTNNPNIKIWNGTSWSAQIGNINIGGVPRALQVISHPTTTAFLACFKDSVSDINCLTSNTTPLWASTSPQEIENNTDSGNQKSFAIGYEQKTGVNGLNFYSGQPNPNTPNWRSLNSSNVWTGESQIGSIGAATESMRIISNTGSDDMMILIASTVQSLRSIVWDGTTHAFGVSGGYVLTTQASNGSNDLDYWYDFEWDQF